MSRKQAVRILTALGASSLVHLVVFAAVGTSSTPALVEGGSAEIHYGSPPGLKTTQKDTQDTPSQRDEAVPTPKPAAESVKPESASPKIESPIQEEAITEKTDTIPDPPEPMEEKQESELPKVAEPEMSPAKEDTGGEVAKDEPSEEAGGQNSEEQNDETTEKNDARSAPAEATQPAASQAGNSDTSNYSGLVMRHLSRVRRPRASSPGSAFVSFTISDNGELEDLQISKSSGSSRFDRDALKVVRSAAPFPPPPAGINRSFSVEIEGE